MLAQQMIRDGDLAEILGVLQDAVRKDGANAKLRVFLFQLLAVLGQWKRALVQLGVAGELDAQALPMVQAYREAIQCEALRAEIFAGRRSPVIFGEPQPWMAQLAEAVRIEAADPDAAARLREQAFDTAPASPGSIDGRRFDWLADADDRLGPMLEAIVNGRYVWIPFMRIARIEIDAPADLRDVVWTPMTFTWTNGAQTVGLVPTRYPGTTEGADALKLARRTEWQDGHPLGQRMFTSGEQDYPLLDARLVEFDHAAADEGDDTDGQGNG